MDLEKLILKARKVFRGEVEFQVVRKLDLAVGDTHNLPCKSDLLALSDIDMLSLSTPSITQDTADLPNLISGLLLTSYIARHLHGVLKQCH